MNKLLTIREVAKIVRVNERTIIGWENKGTVMKAKRDKNNRRIYDNDDIEKLMAFRIVTSFM